MKKSIFSKVFVIISLFLLSPGFSRAELKIGDPAPDFKLKELSGKEHRLADYRGRKIVFLNFFATWCPYCKEEMPDLKKIYEQYGNSGLQLLSVSVREKDSKVSKFVSKNNICHTVLLDTSAETAKKYFLKGFPTNLILDGNGIILYIGSIPPKNFDKIFNDARPSIRSKGAGK
jgi:peroxiredoxin